MAEETVRSIAALRDSENPGRPFLWTSKTADEPPHSRARLRVLVPLLRTPRSIIACACAMRPVASRLSRRSTRSIYARARAMTRETHNAMTARP